MPKEVFRFNYTPSAPLTVTFLPSQPVVISGLSNDHIFEIIRSTNKFYEYACLESAICALPTPPAAVIDVGANIGNHTIFFSRILGSRVISIEPDTRTVALLTDNIALNKVENLVTIYPVAAGHQDTSIAFNQADPKNLGMSCVSLDPPSQKCPAVRMMTIDTIVARHGLSDVSLIKIDVEGFEAQVLIGASKTLAALHPAIMIEMESYDTNSAIVNHLQSLGYNYSLELPAAAKTRLFMASPPDLTRHNRYLIELASILAPDKT